MRRAIVICGLAWAATSAAQDAEFSLRTEGDAVTAKASGTPDAGKLEGAQAQLRWTADTVRGTAFGAPLSVGIKDHTISGIYGEQPVRLMIDRREQKLEVRGLFGGQISNFRVSPKEIEGTIGKCSYDLDAKEGSFVGWRKCGGAGQESARLSIPEPLTKLPDTTLALMLGVLMGSG